MSKVTNGRWEMFVDAQGKTREYVEAHVADALLEALENAIPALEADARAYAGFNHDRDSVRANRLAAAREAIAQAQRGEGT